MASRSMAFELKGVKHLENALKQIPKATAKSVLRRALVKVSKPIVIDAKRLAPVATGRLVQSITVSTRLNKNQKKRRSAKGSVEVFIGSSDRKAHLIEFGSVNSSPRPFMRPAWDSNKDKVLSNLGNEMWISIAKAARTIARKAEKGTLSKKAVSKLIRQ